MDPLRDTRQDLWQRGIHKHMAQTIKRHFSLVAKLNTIRFLLSLATNLDWPLQYFDVKNIFFHCDLKKEIYMDILAGYMAS